MQILKDVVWKSKNADYIGENLSQLEHFILTASKVEELYPTDKELIVAAFLHDIGHQLFSFEVIENLGNRNHESIGAQFLKELGFSERIVFIVQNHVKAKRYLVSKNSEYYDTLSKASQLTLKYQGGFLSQKEVIDCESNPFWKDVISVRECDDKAKNPKEVIDLIKQTQYYLEMCFSLVEKVL